MPPLIQAQPQLTLPAARIAIAAAEAHAATLGIDFNIAIVDASTHLLHFSRMPNAKITSISIAIDKAFTAAGHKNSRFLWISFSLDRILEWCAVWMLIVF